MMSLSVLFLMLHLCWSALGRSFPVVYIGAGCANLNLLKTAQEALDEVNANRREGYIFKLDQLYDYSEKAEVSALSISLHLVVKD